MTHETKDHGPEYRHVDDLPWETLRFPGQHSKMIFHPRPERPSEPNTGFVRYEPGAYHPRHRHDFAQVWHILEGTFRIGERTLGPGTVVFHADPHYEEDLSTETGGRVPALRRAYRQAPRADARGLSPSRRPARRHGGRVRTGDCRSLGSRENRGRLSSGRGIGRRLLELAEHRARSEKGLARVYMRKRLS